ncbi:GGDEF domain-containing protein [Paenibacillus thailandensis]|uniref:GGDEF domain-containing protein n=1 Tax=Paenibacillus thailandensis TaxID=393250 RepID=A0ABW5R2B9_9BACL
MNDTEIGLIDPRLVSAVQHKRRSAAVGVLFVRLSSGRSDPKELLANLNGGQLPCIFGSFCISGDCYFLVECAKGQGSAKVQLERLAGAATAWLEDNAEEESGSAPIVGCSVITSADQAGGEESAIYVGLRTAVERAYRGKREAAAATGSSVAYKNAQEPFYEIGQLASPIPVFQADQKVYELDQFFRHRYDEQGAVIASGSKPVGLIMKEKLHQLLSGPYGLALYSNRELSRIMDRRPLIVEAALSVEQAAQQAMARETAKMYDVVIVTDGAGERLLGAVSIRSLLECITALRTEAARTANPLTGLPGNESIQAKLQDRLRKEDPFAIIYADIDYFKWYNDFYGFAQGDEMIRYLARTLQFKCKEFGAANDFVGHVGGDDFIVLTGMKEPERLCKEIIREFDGGIGFFYEDFEMTEARDREGRAIGQRGVSLSLSLLCIEGTRIYSMERISRLSADLKKRAKAIKGSSYAVGYLH